jgi:hypothetical protein
MTTATMTVRELARELRSRQRAEEKARQARTAIRVLAQLAAKNEVKNQIRAQGLKVNNFSAKDITLRAEALLKERPEIFGEAREKAARLGYC